MAQTYKICLLPGDGIGPEIIAEGVKVLDAIAAKYGVSFEYTEALIVAVRSTKRAVRFLKPRLPLLLAPMRCCLRRSAARSGILPILANHVLNRGCSLFEKAWACMRTFVQS